MLAPLAAVQWQASEIASELRSCAANRKGCWRIETVEYQRGLSAWSLVGWGLIYRKSSIVLTEKEYSKLFATAAQGISSGQKPTIIMGNLQVVAGILWPNGTLDDVACRHLAPDCILRYVTGGLVYGESVWLFSYLATQAVAAALLLRTYVLEPMRHVHGLCAKALEDVKIWEGPKQGSFQRTILRVSVGNGDRHWARVQQEATEHMRHFASTWKWKVAGFGLALAAVSYAEWYMFQRMSKLNRTTLERCGGPTQGSSPDGEKKVMESGPSGSGTKKEESPSTGETDKSSTDITGQAGGDQGPGPPPGLSECIGTTPRIAGTSELQTAAAPTGCTCEPEGGSISLPGANPIAEARIERQPVGLSVRTEDAGVASKMEAHGRYIKEQVGDLTACVVIGQDYDKTKEKTVHQKVGVMLAPSAELPNVYSQTVDNVKAGIKARLTDKARPCTFTKKDKAKIGKMIAKAIGPRGIFSETRVKDWFCEHNDLQEMRSGKWSESRMTAAIEKLVGTVDPGFKLSTNVKLEHMQEGKAPRFLIADGDYGQLMALMTIKSLEELMFEVMEQHSIKHRSKRQAINEMVKLFRPPKEALKRGTVFVEGDGSAWDTTCGVVVRECVENPIIRHITGVLNTLGLQPESWAKAHDEVCSKKTLKMLFSKFGEKYWATITAIRRSGHRGTSCLNFLVNFVMWSCSLFEEPEKFWDPNVRWGKDVAGVLRWFFGGYEGDDSGVQTAPRLIDIPTSMMNEENREKIQEAADKEGVGYDIALCSHRALSFWWRGGFNMKWVFATARATFVGVHLAINEEGYPSGEWSPELPRALANGVSTSRAALDAVEKNDKKGLLQVASATALSRAADFAGILPTVSKKYLDFAEALASHDFQDREMSMRVGGSEGMGAVEVRKTIREQNSNTTQTEELARMKSLGYTCTDSELIDFLNYPWELEKVADHDMFRQSLPASWRKA
jgi:hypothetical protein